MIIETRWGFQNEESREETIEEKNWTAINFTNNPSSHYFIVFFSDEKESAKNEIAKREITEIVYGDVYTFTEEGSRYGYIKIIDGENYVAMPGTKSPEDSFGDGETYDIIFIEGRNSKSNEKLSTH